MRAEADQVIGREALLKIMSAAVGLSPGEQKQIRAMRGDARGKGALIAEDGDAKRFCFLVSGWAFRQSFLADGKRQICGFLVPGDPLEPFGCIGEAVSSGIVAITPVEIVDVSRVGKANGAELLSGIERFNVFVAREHLRYYRNQMIRLGCHNALQRMAHLLLELHDRLSKVGLVTQGKCDFPLTQEMLADALGLSVVHMNRVMKRLRSAGLVRQESSLLYILNRRVLAGLSERLGNWRWITYSMPSGRLP